MSGRHVGGLTLLATFTLFAIAMLVGEAEVVPASAEPASKGARVLSPVHNAWLVTPFSNVVVADHVKTSNAKNRAALLEELKDVPRAFVYLADPACPISEYARPAFAAVAAAYRNSAQFVTSSGSYSVVKGDNSPTLLYVEYGKPVQWLYGIMYPNGGGARQLRAKFQYEAFVVSNLYGIDVAADLRLPISKKFVFMRYDFWLYSFAAREPADLSNRDLRTLISQNSDLRQFDFRNANLSGAKFWYTDLRGAKFDGANLKGTEWAGSICPDGHRVTSRDETCLEHLEGAAQ